MTVNHTLHHPWRDICCWDKRVKAIKTGQQKLYCRWIRFEHLDLILLIVPQHQVQLGKPFSHAIFHCLAPLDNHLGSKYNSTFINKSQFGTYFT